MFTKVKMGGHIKSAIAYFQEKEQLYVMQLQIKYDKSPNPCRPYHVFTFKFLNEWELERFIRDCTVSCGVKDLHELAGKEVNVSLCIGRDDKLISGAELTEVLVKENGEHHWYPMGIGISDKLMASQTVFA